MLVRFLDAVIHPVSIVLIVCGTMLTEAIIDDPPRAWRRIRITWHGRRGAGVDGRTSSDQRIHHASFGLRTHSCDELKRIERPRCGCFAARSPQSELCVNIGRERHARP
jgi:hypothetical protein